MRQAWPLPIVRSPLHRPLLGLRSCVEQSVCFRAPKSVSKPTHFCASPYKTGTTYMAGRFKGRNRVAHEPFHYTSIRRRGDALFFQRRAARLSLDLECSGFLANQLRMIRDALPEARVIHLVRPFTEWLPSAISYFTELADRVRYNYVCRRVFDPITTYPIDCFFRLPSVAQATIVESLLQWWLSAYEEGMADPLCLRIPLWSLDDRIEEVEEFLRLRADRSAVPWKRASNTKVPMSPSDYIDLSPYAGRIEAVEHPASARGYTS
jgi:hypothetical protein